MPQLTATITPRGRMARQVTKAAREAAIATVEYWHANIMPHHFTVAGGKKYEYQPRRGDNEPPSIPRTKPGLMGFQRFRSNPHYTWRKRREKGHQKPLVWSGDSEAAARSGIRTSTRRNAAENMISGVGVMDLPKYFYQYRKDYGAPDKANELTRVSSDEPPKLEEVFEHTFKSALERMMSEA